MAEIPDRRLFWGLMKTKKTLDTGLGVARIAMLLAIAGALVLANACSDKRPVERQIDDGCVTA
jgi:hypothetical protein